MTRCQSCREANRQGLLGMYKTILDAFRPEICAAITVSLSPSLLRREWHGKTKDDPMHGCSPGVLAAILVVPPLALTGLIGPFNTLTSSLCTLASNASEVLHALRYAGGCSSGCSGPPTGHVLQAGQGQARLTRKMPFCQDYCLGLFASFTSRFTS